MDRKDNRSYMEEIQFSVENFNEQMLIKQGYLREHLIKILACIQLSRYQEALNIVEQEIQKGERGGFSNNGKDIYLHVIDYINKIKNQSIKFFC